MRFSLQTREIIADSIETVTCAQRHDANISIPGCDKNMPVSAQTKTSPVDHRSVSCRQVPVLSYLTKLLTIVRIHIVSLKGLWI